MIDERDLAAAVRSAGRPPTATTRAAIRNALSMDIELEPTIERSPRPSDRRTRWALAAAAAAVAGLSVSAALIGDRGSDGSTDLTPISTSATTDPEVLASQLRGARWVQVTPVLPMGGDSAIRMLEFDGEDAALDITVSEGCTQARFPDALRDGVVDLPSESMHAITGRCGSEGWYDSGFPFDGLRVVVLSDRRRLEVRRGDGDLAAAFERVDVFERAGVEQLVGDFDLDDATTIATFRPDGTGTVAGCDVTWTLGAWLDVQRALPSRSACPGELDAASALATSLLFDERIEARFDGAGRLYLLADDAVTRLTRHEWIDGEPPIDTPSGRLYGFAPAEEVEPAAVVETISAELGDLAIDTGWIAPSELPVGACEEVARSVRTVWWGLVRVTFARSAAGYVVVAGWSVGQPQPLGFDPPPAASERPDDSLRAVGTELGITFGSTESELLAAYRATGLTSLPDLVVADELADEVTALGIHMTGRTGVTVAVMDDVVVTIWATTTSC